MQLIEQTVCFGKKPRHGPARPLGPQSTSLFGPVIDFDHPRQFFLLEPHSFGRQTISLLFPRPSTCPPRILSVLEVFAPPKKHSLWSPIIDFRLGRTCQPCNTTAFCPHLGLQLTSIATVANTFQTKQIFPRELAVVNAKMRACSQDPQRWGVSPISLECAFSAIKANFRSFPFVVCQDV
jgi:hypothetical protein